MIRAYRFELYGRPELERMAWECGRPATATLAAAFGQALKTRGLGYFRHSPWGDDYVVELFPVDPTPEPPGYETLHCTGGEFIPAVLR